MKAAVRVANVNLLDRIGDLMELQRWVEAELADRASGMTPYMAKTLEWLGRHHRGTVRQIAAGLLLPRSTVRWCASRLIRDGLAQGAGGRSGTGPQTDAASLADPIELTPAGLRLFDRLRR